MVKVGDFAGLTGTGEGPDWFELLFLDDGPMGRESLPTNRIRLVGFNFRQLEDERLRSEVRRVIREEQRK